MKTGQLRRTAGAMPLPTPSYPMGPCRFIGRAYLTIAWRTDSVCAGGGRRSAAHVIADLILGLGEVVHDDLA